VEIKIVTRAIEVTAIQYTTDSAMLCTDVVTFSDLIQLLLLLRSQEAEDNAASQAERPNTSAPIDFTRIIYIIMHAHSTTA